MAEFKTDKDPTLIKIGAKIRKLRKQNPDYVNYEVFAFTHRINKVTLQRIERGDNYNMESLLKVLKVLNIGLSDFFKDID
jgi:transcriptional regulator with XRE-family HTH domain